MRSESIDTVVNGVLLNLKEDVTVLFENSERNYSTADTAAVISLIDDASDPLASLNTTYRLKSVTQAKYSTVVSNYVHIYTYNYILLFLMYIQKCKPSIFSPKFYCIR